MSRLSVQRFILLAIAAIAIPACGGGGSSGGGAPAILGVVEFASPTANIVEGAAASISLAVNRTGGNQAVTVAWATSNGTATGSEYTGGSGTLNWAAGDTAPQNIDIPISALDATLEAPATFIVTLSAPTGATLGPVLASTVTVTDGDSPGVVEFHATSLAPSFAEGAGTVKLKVTRTGGTVPVSVVVNTADGSATAPADYTALSSFPLASLPIGDTEFDLTIGAGGDGFEPDQTFTVTLTAGSGAVLGTNAVSTVTVTNIDAPPDVPWTVAFSAPTASTTEGTGGTGTVQLTVTRSGGVGAMTVQYASAHGTTGTADSPVDYTPVSGTLSWTAGDPASKTIDISIADFDTLVEGDETFTVTLSNPTNATLGANAVSTVTIADADAPAEGVFQFSKLVYPTAEGVDVVITVRRTSGTNGDASVTLNVGDAGDSATSGADYTAVAPTVLSWLSGESQDQTVNIQILNDGTDTLGVETILLTLTSATPAGGPEISVSQGAATVEITDEDQAGEVAFKSMTFSALENGGVATITLSRSNGSAGAASVDVVLTPGTAQVGVDYTVPATVTVNWGAGITGDQTLDIPLIDNGNADGTRTVALSLTNASGAGIGIIAGATLSILDDDAGFFAFSAPTYSESEANPTITITVNRLVGSVGSASVTVAVVAVGSTADATDYTLPASAVLDFADGETTKDFAITINPDATFEPDETIQLELQSPVNAGLDAQSTAVATITNDDTPPGGVFTLSVVSTTVDEGTVLTVTVNRTDALEDSSVTLKTFNGSAKGNGGRRDYDSQNNVVLNFLAGAATSQTVDIAIDTDTRLEGNETFRVQLVNPSANAGLGDPSILTITIQNVP